MNGVVVCVMIAMQGWTAHKAAVLVIKTALDTAQSVPRRVGPSRR